MNLPTQHLRRLAWLLPLCSAMLVHAGADEGRWWSYRDAYRSLVRFEKQSQPKHLIQQRLQLQPLSSGQSAQGLRLSLSGEHTDLDLPLDAGLHTRVPLLKSAYDDNAALRLNRAAEAYAFRVRVSITPRPDGNYPVAELRQACEQVLEFQNQVDPDQYRGKRCVGVSLAFARGSNPGVSYRLGNSSRNLTTSPGPLYPGEPDRDHPVLSLRWEAGGDGAMLSTPSAPLVIAAMLE